MSGRKGYFVWYSFSQYDPDQLDFFATEPEFLDFINSHAGESEFQFRTVLGTEIGVEAVEVVRKYRIKVVTAPK